MVATYLSQYLEEKDSHGIRIGEWAEQAEPGFFKCKFCFPQTQKTLSFKKGKIELLRHASSERHRHLFLSSSSKQKSRQPTIQNVLNNDNSEDKKKVDDFEIALCMILARHNVQFSFVDCLVEILKKYVTDSDIVKKMKLSRHKIKYFVNIVVFCR